MPTPEEDRNFKRQVALRRHQEEQAAAAKSGRRVKEFKEAAQNPGKTAEGALRIGVRYLVVGLWRGLRAVVLGIADARHNVADTPNQNTPTLPMTIDVVAKDAHTNAPIIPTIAAPQEMWIVRKKKELDQRVADLANTPHSLGSVAFVYGARWTYGLLHWSWTTYPHALRVWKYAADAMRRRLDAKIARQASPATNWQKLRRRLLSPGPSNSVLGHFLYAGVNMLSAGVVASTTLATVAAVGDAAYSYATYHVYKNVEITNIFRNPTGTDYAAEVHGMQILPDGKKEPIFVDLTWSLWYGKFFPQYQISEMSIGDKCDLRTYGVSEHIPVAFRRIFTWNPQLISAANCVRVRLPGAPEPQ